MTSQEFNPVTLCDLVLDRCRNEYGAAPCAAGTVVHSGTAVGASNDTMTLAASASAVDDAYNGMALVSDDGRRGVIIDYDGTQRVATIDKIEGAARWKTNLLPHSEQFDAPSTPWTNARVELTRDRRAPNGTMTASFMADDASSTTGDHGVRYDFNWGNIDYVLSCYAKYADGHPYLVLDHPNSAFADGEGVWFNLQTGQIDKFEPSEYQGQAGMIRLWDGWFRCWCWLNADTVTTGNLSVNMAPSTADRSYVGTEGTGILIWGAQLEGTSRLRPYLDTDGTAKFLTDLASADYRVIDAGGECYNTFGTCQDKDNYRRETRPLRFCDQWASVPPGFEIRPTIRAKSFAATKIDIEKGLAVRGTVGLTLRDEPGGERVLDPYVDTRTTPATGTFWARALARSQNYSTRRAIICRAYLPGNRAFNQWDCEYFVHEAYQIESISRPDQDGNVRVTLKDPIKFADRRDVPDTSEGKLDAALGVSDLSLFLQEGAGASYPAAGYVRVGKEIIQYTQKNPGDPDELQWPDTSYRAQFNTTAATAQVGNAVQLCRVWIDTPITTVMQDLLVEAGIDPVDIDAASFAAEEQLWLGSIFNITAAISKPTKATKLLQEACELARGYLWWAPADQVVKFSVFAPVLPNEAAVPELTDGGNFVERSIDIEPEDKLRITHRSIFYDPISPTVDLKDPVNYLRAAIRIDLDAESENEYGDSRDDSLFTQMWGAPNEVAALAQVGRALAYYRNAPLDIQGRVSGKDSGIIEGDQVDVFHLAFDETRLRPER